MSDEERTGLNLVFRILKAGFMTEKHNTILAFFEKHNKTSMPQNTASQ